jgi:DNA repair exonuclease SbcCD nuclease subunit
MKILRVGDVHVKPNNLRESEALLEFVLSKALELEVDKVEFLGDLFDTHSIVRLEVLEFWHRWFHIFSEQQFKTIILVGNHDISGDYSNNYSALTPFMMLCDTNFDIINTPTLDGVYGYLPYIHSNEKFVQEANKLAEQGATVLVSHPNFEGAVYDNGSDVLGGVRDSDIDNRYLHLIGGHIHTELELGRIWYTGNPRWMTKSCANKRKGIWLVNHDDNTGAILSKEFISTESVCTPIISLTWKEGEEKPTIPEKASVNIELIGSSNWVTEQKKELKGVSISSKITDIKKSRERKSGKSLEEFLIKYYDKNSSNSIKILKYLKELNLV